MKTADPIEELEQAEREEETRAQSQQDAARAAYVALVRSLADGGSPSVREIQRVIRGVRESATNLKADVGRLRERRRLAAMLAGSSPDAVEMRERIRATQEALESLQAERDRMYWRIIAIDQGEMARAQAAVQIASEDYHESLREAKDRLLATADAKTIEQIKTLEAERRRLVRTHQRDLGFPKEERMARIERELERLRSLAMDPESI